jgi:hypothetical protein
LPSALRIVVVSTGAYLFQLCWWLLLLSRSNSSEKNEQQAKALRCFGLDLAVLLSSLVGYVGCAVAFPQLLTPFRWIFFAISLVFVAGGWILDYAGFRAAPRMYYSEINVHNRSLRWSLAVTTLAAIITFHLANEHGYGVEHWEISVTSILWIGSTGAFGMFFGRLFSRFAVLTNVIR